MTTVLEKLSAAERWLAKAKSLDELQQIHDIAVAADAYARAHRLGLSAENHAMEVRLLAARRIGELVPATPPEERSPGRQGKPALENTSEGRTYSIPKQRLSEFRKLAEIPEQDFRERIEVAKAREEKITYNRMLRGDWYQTSDSPEWETPQWLFDLLDDEFHFVLDVCASARNHKCSRYFSKADDGLGQDWGLGPCWMNPPYGRDIKAWMAKAVAESERGITVVCLVPARTDTEWWWENCIHGEIRFIRGRLQWPGSDVAAPFPSAVVILGRGVQSRVVWWDVQAGGRV